MADEDQDIHICGKCRLEFSNLHDFINHKQICRNKVSKDSESLSKSSSVSDVILGKGSSSESASVLQKMQDDVEPGSTPSAATLSVMLDNTAISPELTYLSTVSQESSSSVPQVEDATQPETTSLLKRAGMEIDSITQLQSSTGQAITASLGNPENKSAVQTLTSSLSAGSNCLAEMQQLSQLDSKTGQISYQLTYHNNMPVLTVITGNHGDATTAETICHNPVVITDGPAESSAIAIPQGADLPVQITSTHVPLNAKLSSEGVTDLIGSAKVTKPSPKVTKRAKYARLTSVLKAANARSSSTLENLDVATSCLPEGMVERYVQSKAQRRYRCTAPGCTYVTQYAKNVDRHMLVHTGDRPHACHMCSAKFSRADHLKDHIRIHLGDKRYKCTHCSYSSTDSGSLKKHLRIHTDERPFKCQLCPYASRNSSQLTVHLRTHTGDKPFMCPECSACFKIKSDLKRHRRLHTGERPFTCEICGVKTAIRSNLLTHMKIHHNSEKLTKCQHCDFTSSSKREIQSHAKTHLQPPERLRCPQCSFVSTNSAALQQHVAEHNSDKQFSCVHCNYFSRSKAALNRHVKCRHPKEVRRGRKPKKVDEPKAKIASSSMTLCNSKFTCDLCPAEFVRKDSLRSHLRSHKENEQYEEEKRLAQSTITSDGTYQVTHEHEYAANDEESQSVVKVTKEEGASSSTLQPYSSSSSSGGSTTVAENSRLSEHRRIQALLPYVQNNHNMAMLDNIQNSAISEEQGKLPLYVDATQNSVQPAYMMGSSVTQQTSYTMSAQSTATYTEAKIYNQGEATSDGSSVTLTTRDATAMISETSQSNIINDKSKVVEEGPLLGTSENQNIQTVTPTNNTTAMTTANATPLSSLSPEVQAMLCPLNLPLGTLLSVPLGDQDFQIIMDIPPTTDMDNLPTGKSCPVSADEQTNPISSDETISHPVSVTYQPVTSPMKTTQLTTTMTMSEASSSSSLANVIHITPVEDQLSLQQPRQPIGSQLQPITVSMSPSVIPLNIQPTDTSSQQEVMAQPLFFVSMATDSVQQLEVTCEAKTE